jgi:hypothetical protein
LTYVLFGQNNTDHLIVCVLTSLNNVPESEFSSTVKDMKDWYPVEPASAVGSREPLPVSNSNGRAGYVLLRRVKYIPDDDEGNVSEFSLQSSIASG